MEPKMQFRLYKFIYSWYRLLNHFRGPPDLQPN
jgi:hypothetical protein